MALNYVLTINNYINNFVFNKINTYMYILPLIPPSF